MRAKVTTSGYGGSEQEPLEPWFCKIGGELEATLPRHFEWPLGVSTLLLGKWMAVGCLTLL